MIFQIFLKLYILNIFVLRTCTSLITKKVTNDTELLLFYVCW